MHQPVTSRDSRTRSPFAAPHEGISRRESRSLSRRIVLSSLQGLTGGTLRVSDPLSTTEFGQPDRESLTAEIQILNARFFRETLIAGSLGFAESYLRGDWETPDLVSVIRLFCRNLEEASRVDRGLARYGLTIARWAHQFARNSLSGSRQNIAAHYDLSNEFFQLFLDPTMMYSSAWFADDDVSLEQASQDKLDRICRRLDLCERDHVMEIGTGWGGFAIYAAQQYGCRVTTTTISQQQYDWAQEKIRSAGLTDRVTLLFEDYRKLEGRYDKVVSIEMIEAVGHRYLGQYFRKCYDLLKPQGRLLIQAITIPEHRYDRYRKSVDFIQKYIFPGGHLPSIGEMQRVIGQHTRLLLTHQDDFGASYARTLREWRKRFHAQIDHIRSLGFDERFLRMWDYYFSYCEAAFLEQSVGVSQLMWQRPQY